MTTTGVTNETVPWLKTEQTTTTTTTTDVNNTLDKDAFLKLLLTELKYQDPMDPVKDKEFMAQMASFSTLEQMTNLNTSFSQLSSNITDNLLPGLLMQQSGTMIGREVTYINPDDSTASLTGIIESALITNGTAYYVIDGKEVAANNILEIGDQCVSIDQVILNEILKRLDDLTSHLIPGEDDEDG